MKTLLLSLAYFALCCVLIGQNTVKWMHKGFEQKCFIQNYGQFDENSTAVLYGAEDDGVQIYFSKNRIAYRIDTFRTLPKNKPKHEEELPIVEKYSYILNLEWMGTNPATTIISSEKREDVFHYAYLNSNQNIYNVPAYKKITYKNIYTNIDLEYVFHPSQGIKYSFTVHPGGNVKDIRWKATNNSHTLPNIDTQGNLHFQSPWGDFIDHKPVSFCQDNPNVVIPTEFILKDSIVSFNVGVYNPAKTLIIDPWTTNPTLTTQNKVFEIERDLTGNVFIYGGYNPYKLRKYDPAGIVQWTLNTPYGSAFRFGDLAISGAGDIYITASFNASITRVNTGGTVIYTNTNTSLYEYWGIVSNCTTVYLSRSFPGAYISTLNEATGNMIGEVNLTPAPQDERAMCIAPTGDFYMVLSESSANLPLIKVSPAFAIQYTIASCGHTSPYNMTPGYANGPSPIIAPYNGVAVGNNFFVHSSGATLYKRSLATGALLASVSIPGGVQDQNSGLAIDECDRIYVGNNNAVLVYDASLTLLSTNAVGNAVYAVSIGLGGEVLAGGLNFAAALNLSACSSVICRTLPTPVVTSLKLEKKEKYAHLSWQYDNAQNITSFEIERSTNGTDFHVIHNLNANHALLEFSDTQTPQNQIVYYRVVAKTKDGKNFYSNVVNTIITSLENAILNVYPNPVTRYKPVVIDYISSKKDILPLMVWDMTGKVIYQEQVYCNTGINHIEFFTDNIGKGNYWIGFGKDKRAISVIE